MSRHQDIDYMPFLPFGNQIRILTLNSGGVHDPIKCALHIVSLDDQPAYEALSYTWGDPGVTKIIQVDGTQVNVTSNLESALRHLREANNDLILWVDAVCINQNDMEEKSRQVALMGQIYRQCSQVRIWLGCTATECGLGGPLREINSSVNQFSEQHDPFGLIRHLAEDGHIHDWPCFDKSGEEGHVSFKDTESFRNFWTGFLTVAKSVWWSRVWTVQEVILPKIGILTYDTWSTPLEDITKCGTNYYNHVWSCCQQATTTLPGTIGIPLDEICTNFFTLDHDRNALAENKYFDIQEQHLSYGSRQCQNPRDKVYGLLAIIGDISSLKRWLTPDYSSSENKIFHDTTCAMLVRDPDSLKCLVGAEYGPGMNKWASWVRNFGEPLKQLDADIGLNRLMVYELFNASSGRKAKYEHIITWPQSEDENIHQAGLGLKGTCIGRVKSVQTEVNCGDSTEEVKQRKGTLKRWIKASKVDVEGYNHTKQHPEEIEKLWRTILGGIVSMGSESTEYSDWRRFTSEAMVWLEQFLAWVDTGEPDCEFALDRTILTSTHGRCYFQTNDGGQGLCYPKVQTGDEVWVIDGSKVPFVLRKAQLNQDQKAMLRPKERYGLAPGEVVGVPDSYEPGELPDRHYELLGDCYLDGFMDGEATESTNQRMESFILL